MENNTFKTLSQINVNGMVEKKNSLTYLSWAYAWSEVKKLYPNATYKVYEREDPQFGPINYFTDGRTAWVKVGVTIEGLEHVEMLPVMDYRNKSIALDKVTSCDVNKTIQRAITKAIGRHGLGLYVYAKEGLPEGESQSQNTAQPAQLANKPIEKAPAQPQAPAQKPAQRRDTRPATKEMLCFIRKAIAERSIPIEFICKSYKVSKLEDLRVYQAIHIKDNLSKLERMYLADIVEQSKQAQAQAEARTELTFGDAIAPSQPQQEKAEGEDVSLESLGLSPADLDALTECGNVFN